MRWLQGLPTLEVLVINLIATDICLKRKYSRRKTVAVLTLFTAMVFSIAYVFSDPAQYQGDGKMMLAGFVYLPVLYALYRVRLAELFTLMCSCWVYTFGIFSLAFLCSATWFSGQFFWSLFLEQVSLLLLKRMVRQHLLQMNRERSVKFCPSDNGLFLFMLMGIWFEM